MPMNANTDVKVTPKTISTKAKKNVDSKQHSEPIANSEPFFKRFSWYAVDPQTADASLIHDARDLADGLSLIMDMVETNDLAKDLDEQPMLSPFHRGQLMRLAIASARVLASTCHTHIEISNKRNRRQAGAGE